MQERRLYSKLFKNFPPKTLNSISIYNQTAAAQGKFI